MITKTRSVPQMTPNKLLGSPVQFFPDQRDPLWRGRRVPHAATVSFVGGAPGSVRLNLAVLDVDGEWTSRAYVRYCQPEEAFPAGDQTSPPAFSFCCDPSLVNSLGG